jgi:nucleoid DNA-binding protein
MNAMTVTAVQPETEASSASASLTALIEEVADLTGLPRTKVRDVLEVFGQAVARELCAGRRVRLPVIGLLRPYPRNPRTGTAPGGVAWTSPGGVRLGIKASKVLQTRLDQAG